MITIISSVLGFFASGIPALIDLFKDKSDKSHELKIMEMQMVMAEKRINEKLDAVALEQSSKQNIAEIKALYKTYSTGIKWVDAFNGTVRPVIAYLLILLYCVIEYMIFHVMFATNNFTLEMLEFLWSEEDQALFVAIISYYFGSRSFKRSTP